MVLRRPGRAELLELVRKHPERAVDLILELFDRVDALTNQVVTLTARVRDLEEELAKNSANSGRPPSSDRFSSNKPAPKSLRKRSKKRRGGQPGHPGRTLKMATEPDVVEVLPVQTCGRCGQSLNRKPVVAHEARQVYDVQIEMVATEYRAETKECRCGETCRALFPQGVDHRTQYGPNLRGLLVYMNQYQLIPYARTAEFIRDLTGHNVSEGTLYNSVVRCHRTLELFETRVKSLLIQAPHAGFDETGAKCAGKLHWIHTACTETLTLLQLHARRGYTAMWENGILPFFRGVALHDYMKSYYRFTECAHSLCGAHIVRELVFLREELGRKWADRMRQLLLRMEAATDRARNRGDPALDARLLGRLEAQYDRAVTSACRAERRNRTRTSKRGRIKQSKARNMAERLRDRKEDILRFLHDLSVPFTNNMSERSFRMAKAQQKISGCFRSLAGAEMQCRIRSYIDTSKKNGLPILEALASSVRGKPFIPGVRTGDQPCLT